MDSGKSSNDAEPTAPYSAGDDCITYPSDSVPSADILDAFSLFRDPVKPEYSGAKASRSAEHKFRCSHKTKIRNLRVAFLYTCGRQGCVRPVSYLGNIGRSASVGLVNYIKPLMTHWPSRVPPISVSVNLQPLGFLRSRIVTRVSVLHTQNLLAGSLIHWPDLQA